MYNIHLIRITLSAALSPLATSINHFFNIVYKRTRREKVIHDVRANHPQKEQRTGKKQFATTKHYDIR